MIIETNCEYLLYELRQIADLFEVADDFTVKHCCEESAAGYINRVECGGRVFGYERGKKPNESELERKRYLKRYAKLALYKALSEVTGQKSQWGALTGIRPVKLAYSAEKEGMSPAAFLREEMLVSEKKADMTEKILLNQRGIYRECDDDCDLYVSVPFCPTKCVYCSFISAELKAVEKFVEPYVEALCSEIESAKKSVKNLRCVYIGGGTPVALDRVYMEKILRTVGEAGCEYTVEAGRADCITADKLKLLKDYGVNRICVNPQTFNDKTLVAIGRKHTAAEVVAGYELARGYGFDINMDLIAGLPGEDFSDFCRSVDTAVSLKPENITVHTLSLKKGSELKERESKLFVDNIGKMIDYSYGKLTASGYGPYYMYRQKYTAGNLENTGYCLNGKQCVYNIDNMEERAQIIACGANAVSKRVFNAEERIERLGNPKDLKTYLDKIQVILQEKRAFFA